MIARCTCGDVEYELCGKPIVSLVCFCDDCQTGSRELEALPGAAAVRDADGGTPYVVFRKDRVRCTRGAELLEKHKLQEGSLTSRLAARCCNTALVMWFEDSKHWAPFYRDRLGGDAPGAEMRICTKFAPASTQPSDVPGYPGYPVRLVTKLVSARIAMVFGR